MSNTDKRGIVLDLKHPNDREILWKLLATADMVIENLRPGALAKFGFGGDDVLRRLPHIIYCSVNGFGYDTAYPGRPALDTVIQAMSGAMAVTSIDGVPTKAGISISDQLGGQFGLAGMLAALEYRERTGRGLHLDLAMQDCSAWATQMAWNGGWRSDACIIPATDGFVVAESQGALGSDAITERGRQMTRDALVAELNRANPDSAAPVLTVAEVMAHPQTLARGLFKEVPTADGTSWLVPESPLRLLSTPAKARSTMPRLGFLDADLAAEFELDGVGAQQAIRA
jgi:crotonobetainyl-CoA:carnitine CoA-transferase CaiB-like acyl-CoA transferase